MEISSEILLIVYKVCKNFL